MKLFLTELIMDFQKLEVFPIHNRPEYKEKCCTLINAEWPRSKTARMVSLNASSDRLPTSLVMITEDKKLIGHCKLSPIHGKPTTCFIQSFVISKELRGKKLGTFLMGKTEDYCRKKLNLKSVHLSTTDKEGFYLKLGYKVCSPISFYGSQPSYNFTFSIGDTLQKKEVAKSKEPTGSITNAPPPPPIPTGNRLLNNKTENKQIFMYKEL